MRGVIILPSFTLNDYDFIMKVVAERENNEGLLSSSTPFITFANGIISNSGIIFSC